MKINVRISEDQQTFNAKFRQDCLSFNANFGEIHRSTEYVGGNPFDGDYTVTPKVDSQTMPTKGRIMLDDVTIKAIPFFNVSNNSGGSTVYIAKEI